MGSGINREVSTLLIASTGRVIAVSTINGLTSWENERGGRVVVGWDERGGGGVVVGWDERGGGVEYEGREHDSA